MSQHRQRVSRNSRVCMRRKRAVLVEKAVSPASPSGWARRRSGARSRHHLGEVGRRRSGSKCRRSTCDRRTPGVRMPAALLSTALAAASSTADASGAALRRRSTAGSHARSAARCVVLRGQPAKAGLGSAAALPRGIPELSSGRAGGARASRSPAGRPSRSAAPSPRRRAGRRSAARAAGRSAVKPFGTRQRAQFQQVDEAGEMRRRRASGRPRRPGSPAVCVVGVSSASIAVQRRRGTRASSRRARRSAAR